MPGRYAITFGRGAHRHALRARAEEQGLGNIVDTQHILFVGPEGTPFLAADGCLLLGQAFTSTNTRLNALPAARRAPRNAVELVSWLDGCWGNFVLFFGTGDGASVYRDPSGSVAAYRCGSTPEAIFVSDAEFAARLDLPRDSVVDLQFAVHWLQFPFLRTRRTGIEGVVEVLPGMLHTRAQGKEWCEIPGWRPASFLKRNQAIMQAEEAAARLRELALAVIPAQSEKDGAVLQLSGGLDSSIVAACLAQSERTFSCVNFATRSGDGDERYYARDVANAFQLTLLEMAEAEPSALELNVRPDFRPPTNPLLLPFERAIERAIEDVGSPLLIDGAGGDNLFCYITSAAPVIDALRWRGLREAFVVIADIAARAGCTWWDVVRAAARRAWTGRPRWKEDRSFLRPGLILKEPEAHPWLDGLRWAPPGKREHVEALVHIQHFLDRRSSPIPVLHPLMAQPLLELCLRVPSWLWMRGGRDRAIARKAFKGFLPSSVLERRSKGSLQGLFHRSFSRLRGEIRDLLMSGELRSAGIIDPHLLEATFERSDWMRDDMQLRISELVALELWLRSWRPHAAIPTSASAGPTADTARPFADQGRDGPEASSGTSRGSAHKPPDGDEAEP
jgi:asparagine synthase (glutamine-hydrolysing)